MVLHPDMLQILRESEMKLEMMEQEFFIQKGLICFEDKGSESCSEDDRLSEAEMMANVSDVVILCVGLDSTIEGEEGDTGNAFAAGDKPSLFLPDSQRRLMERVISTGKPVILVSNTGSAMDYSA